MKIVELEILLNIFKDNAKEYRKSASNHKDIQALEYYYNGRAEGIEYCIDMLERIYKNK